MNGTSPPHNPAFVAAATALKSTPNAARAPNRFTASRTVRDAHPRANCACGP
jgi:hypothetical protein